MLAVSAYIPAPFRSGYFVHFAKLILYDSLHCILPSFYAFTSAPHSFGKYSFPFRKLIHSVFPKPFSNAFPAVCFYFLRRVCPNKENPFGFILEWFLFQKDSKNKSQKDKYNKDFLSIIFTDKKIKNLAKIRRPTPIHALGSKGQALRVLRKNLHTYASLR